MTDGISPTFVSAETTTTTTIDVTFSEDIVDSGSDLGQYTINGVIAGSHISSKSVSGAVLTLTTTGYTMLYEQTITLSFTGAANELEDTVTLNDVATFATQAVTNNVREFTNDECYDCSGPIIQEAQISFSSDNYILTSGDESTHITANVGDEVTLLLKIADNQTVETIPFIGVYTNFIERPSDMSLYYTNHYDGLKQVSTSFSEWNVRSDDVSYDYDGSASWTNGVPTIVNDPIIGEYLMVPFTMKFTGAMETSQIAVKSSDVVGNYSYELLPVTLEVLADATIDFEPKKNQVILSFFDESVLSIMISELTTSDNITTPISSLFRISEDSLPTWTSDLAKWTAEGKITSGDLIVAAEYLINQ